jgi:thiamine-phosphate pyrophosphorylase
MSSRVLGGKGNSVQTTKILRLIDANLNRCREGLRVIEDTARFVLGRDKEYIAVRKLRHRLDSVTRTIYPELLRQRDTKSDAGRTIAEGSRPGLEAVLAANFRRAEESLRVLEEYGKLIAPDAAPELKALRFAVYSLEKKFLGKKESL